MAKRKDETASRLAEVAGISCVVYDGPHARIQLRNVPQLGELTLVRGAVTDVPPAVGATLVLSKKVRAATSEEIDARDAAAATAGAETVSADAAVEIAGPAGEPPIGE